MMQQCTADSDSSGAQDEEKDTSPVDTDIEATLIGQYISDERS